MGGVVDVFSSSHKKDKLIKELGGNDVIIWTKDEHLAKKGYYDVIVNTLPVGADEKTYLNLTNCLASYGKWI